MLHRLLAFTFLALFSATRAYADPATDFAGAIAPLPDASYGEKADIVKRVLEIRAPGSKEFLQAFLDGNLYARTEDKKIFIAVEHDGKFELTDPLTRQAGGAADIASFDKIGTNNSLRKALRGAVAQFDLLDSNAAVRLAAVKDMQRAPDDDTVALLREQLPKETDDGVRAAIVEGIALADLSSEDAATRLAAAKALAKSLNPDVYNKLKSLLERSEAGDYAEPDANVRAAALDATVRIERWRAAYSTAETTFFGLSLGSVLVLAAIGLAITFGVMGIINMAHGELIMLGAYTTFQVQQWLPNDVGLSIVLAIPLAFLVSGAVGAMIEIGIVKQLQGRPLETLLATFGVSLILQQLVRQKYGANNVAVESPSWLSGSIEINPVFAITNNRLFILVFALVIFAIMLVVLKRTRLGLNVRAVAQNRNMAKAMGVQTWTVDTMTFALGSGIAGVAGVALSQISNTGPNLGQQHIVDSFMVVVFGGVGNLWGTLIGGMSLGVVNKVLEPYSGAVLAKIFVLVAIILFIQRRPRGLFPQKGRAAEH